MKLVLIFFFILVLTIIVETDVKVYVFHGYEFHNNVKRTKPEPRDSFIFGYHRNETLSIQIYLSFNKSVYKSTDLYVQYPPGVMASLLKLTPKVSTPDERYYEFRRLLSDSEIVIELQSNTTTGVLTRNQIVRAVDVTGLANETNEFPYNDICLGRRWCVIEVDLLNDVKTDTNTSTTYYVITVIPSILSVVAVVVVIFAIKTRCWKKNDRSERPLPPIPQQPIQPVPYTQYYENVVLRGQCDLEIQAREEAHYEEIM